VKGTVPFGKKLLAKRDRPDDSRLLTRVRIAASDKWKRRPRCYQLRIKRRVNRPRSYARRKFAHHRPVGTHSRQTVYATHTRYYTVRRFIIIREHKTNSARVRSPTFRFRARPSVCTYFTLYARGHGSNY